MRSLGPRELHRNLDTRRPFSVGTVVEENPVSDSHVLSHATELSLLPSQLVGGRTAWGGSGSGGCGWTVLGRRGAVAGELRGGAFGVTTSLIFPFFFVEIEIMEREPTGFVAAIVHRCNLA